MPLPTIVDNIEYLNQTEARMLLGRGKVKDRKTFNRLAEVYHLRRRKDPTDARVWLYRREDVLSIMEPVEATQEEIDARKRKVDGN